MAKFTDWEEWLAQVHPPVQKYASREYLDNPDNWGPPMPKYKEMLNRLTRDELIKLYFQVDKESPSYISWRRPLNGCVGSASTILSGTPALAYKSLKKLGYPYYQGKAMGKLISAHRVVYFLTHSVWPQVVDHIDGNTLNNSPQNLRESTPAKNAQNLKGHSVRGYYWDKRNSKFNVRIAGKHVTRCVDALTARAEYIRAYMQHYGHLPTA